MKIGIIGAGTASAISIMTLIQEITDSNADIEISCIHDPTIPTARVGESASALVYKTMQNVLGLDFLEDLNEYDGTLRYYTKFNWEQANNNNFSVFYYNPGIHLNSDQWGSYIFKKLGERYPFFSEIHDTFIQYEQTEYSVIVSCKNKIYEFDFLIDCRGMPSKEELDSDEYTTDVFQSVNSVILFPDFKKYDENFTSAYVHKNGWMFGVPLQHRKAFGYLYNNNITSYEEAVADFSEIKGIDATPLRNFSWKQYYKKEALVHRVLSMGNKLYFLEPHGAIPLHYYVLITEGFIRYLLRGADIRQLNKTVNNFNVDALENIQNLIAFNYCGENNINSNFWNRIKEAATKRLQNSESWQHWIKSTEESNEILGYAPADPSMMRSYIDGFKIDISKLKK